MGKKDQQPSVALPDDVRLLVPVMGAVGGSGRSTVAGLLGCAMSTWGATVVLDTTPRLTSSWPSWAREPGAGLASVPADRPASRRTVRAAASGCSGPRGRQWQVLTDNQEWHCPPLPLPQDPSAWHQLAGVGGWQAVITDTCHPAAHDIVDAQHTGRPGLAARWCSLPCSVPVLCAAATSAGVHALQQVVMAASATGLPVQRMVAAVVATGEGRLPAAVKAAVTMLQPRVAAVVQVPFDQRIRTHGMRDAARLKPRAQQAAETLAHAVLASAHAAWGDPLPAAASPAPLPPLPPMPPSPVFPSASTVEKVLV